MFTTPFAAIQRQPFRCAIAPPTPAEQLGFTRGWRCSSTALRQPRVHHPATLAPAAREAGLGGTEGALDRAEAREQSKLTAPVPSGTGSAHIAASLPCAAMTGPLPPKPDPFRLRTRPARC